MQDKKEQSQIRILNAINRMQCNEEDRKGVHEIFRAYGHIDEDCCDTNAQADTIAHELLRDMHAADEIAILTAELQCLDTILLRDG